MSGQVRLRAPGLCTIPGFYIVFIVSDVFTPVGINICPQPVLLIIPERSRISVASEFCFRPPSFCPLTRFQTILEVTDVCGAVSIAVRSMPLHFIASKFPNVAVTRQFCFWAPSSDTLPRLHSINKRTAIFTTVGISIYAFTVRDPRFVLTDVFSPIGKTVGTLAAESII